MFQVPFSDQVRNELHVPTIAVGNIFEADHVNTIIAAGRADLCALARPHLADPSWTLHAAAEQGVKDIVWPGPTRAARFNWNAIWSARRNSRWSPDDQPGARLVSDDGKACWRLAKPRQVNQAIACCSRPGGRRPRAIRMASRREGA
jgi:hypothetical protein